MSVRSRVAAIFAGSVSLLVVLTLILIPLITSVNRGSVSTVPDPLHGSRLSRIHQIERQTSGIRSLQPLRSVHVTFLTNKPFDRVVSSFYRNGGSRRQIRIGKLESVMVGLISPSVNLLKVATSGLTKQVVGLYDHKTKRLYIRNSGHALSIDRWTIAHEFTHALQDQHFHIAKVEPDQSKWKYKDSDAELAEHSLIEGDAVQVQYTYLQRYYSAADLTALRQEEATFRSPPVPAIINEQFQFPYSDGQNYVDWLIQRGGYNAVDKALRNPPKTTFAVMFPGVRIHAARITLKGASGEFSRWRVVDDDVDGAFGYYQLVERYAAKATAMRLARLWRGDRYMLLRSKNENVMYMKSSYSSPKAAHQALTILRRSVAVRFHKPCKKNGSTWWNGSGSTFAAIEQHGVDLILAYAPSSAVARSLSSSPVLS